MEPNGAARGGQVVVFSLDGEEYGLAVARVQEIIRFTPPRTIGSTVHWLRGVISLRGRIVPVCDLASRFGRGPTHEGANTKIVIVEGAGNVAGVLVDEVTEVLTLKDEQVDELPAAGADFQCGVAKVAERLIVLLDPDRLLGGMDHTQLQAVESPAAEAAPAAPGLAIDLLEQSFDLLAPRGEELVARFYEILFDLAPAAKPLFASSDMAKQRANVLGALVLVRNSLRDLGPLIPKLEAMGARHVAYGTRPEHYPIVGQALLAAMADLAGDAWTPALEQAWSDAYGVVAGVMLAGAAQAELPAAA